MKKHIIRKHGGRGKVEVLTIQEASITIKEYLLRKGQIRSNGQITRCLGSTTNEEVRPYITLYYIVCTHYTMCRIMARLIVKLCASSTLRSLLPRSLASYPLNALLAPPAAQAPRRSRLLPSSYLALFEKTRLS